MLCFGHKIELQAQFHLCAVCMRVCVRVCVSFVHYHHIKFCVYFPYHRIFCYYSLFTKQSSIWETLLTTNRTQQRQSIKYQEKLIPTSPAHLFLLILINNQTKPYTTNIHAIHNFSTDFLNIKANSRVYVLYLYVCGVVCSSRFTSNEIHNER